MQAKVAHIDTELHFGTAAVSGVNTFLVKILDHD